MSASVAIQITIGAGRRETKGRVEPLKDNAVSGLVKILRDRRPVRDGWWSFNVWRGGRAKERWVAAGGIAVDVDYHNDAGEHVAIPIDVAAQFTQLAREGGLPGNFFHLTPRGLRVAFVFESPVRNREEFERSALGACALVEKVVIEAGARGLSVDVGVSCDAGRLFFAPNAIVGDVNRKAEIIEMRPAPFTPAELVPHAPATKAPEPPPEPKARNGATVHAHPAASTIMEALKRYNDEHAREFPRGRGTCPVCGHNECFGQLKDTPTRWSCFSTNHTGAGRPSGSIFWGDAIDIDAFLASLTPVELLRREGYLQSKTSPSRPHVAQDESEPPEDVGDECDVVDLHSEDARAITKSYASACWVLRSPELRAKLLGDGDLEFNEQTLTPTVGRRPLTDEALSALRERCELELRTPKGKPVEFSRETLELAVLQVAHERSYHPVQHYLRSLEWDGTERIAHMAQDFLSLPRDALTSSILRKWMISAVARALSPGCKVDTVLILVGPQGVGKSTFFSTLAGEDHFSDSSMDLSSKDAYLTLRKAWIVEWAELESMQRARAAGTVKAFITSRFDTFRAPFERAARTYPRACVIVGSTNDDRFLADPTGGRRYWTVEAPHQVNIDALASARDQLWAEAVALFERGERWWLSGDEEEGLSKAQETYLVRDPWEEKVVSFIEAQCALAKEITVTSILANCIEKRTADWSTNDMHRVASILRRNGWARSRPRGETGERLSVWKPRGGRG